MYKEISLPTILVVPKLKTAKSFSSANSSWLRKTAAVALVLLNAGLLFSYILGVNSSASTGYDIKNLQGKVANLTQENKKMTLQISEMAQVSSLENRLLGNGYSLVRQTKFLQTQNQYTQARWNQNLRTVTFRDDN